MSDTMQKIDVYLGLTVTFSILSSIFCFSVGFFYFRRVKTRKHFILTKMSLFLILFAALNSLMFAVGIPMIRYVKNLFCNTFLSFLVQFILHATNPWSMNLSVLVAIYRLKIMESGFLDEQTLKRINAYAIALIFVTTLLSIVCLLGATPWSKKEIIGYGCFWHIEFETVFTYSYLVADLTNTAGSLLLIFENRALSKNMFEKGEFSHTATGRFKKVLKYINLNAYVSLIIYKPFIIAYFIGLYDQRTYLYLFVKIFVMAISFCLDNCLTSYCIYKMSAKEPNAPDSNSRSSRTSQSNKSTSFLKDTGSNSMSCTDDNSKKGISASFIKDTGSTENSNNIMTDSNVMIVDHDSIDVAVILEIE